MFSDFIKAIIRYVNAVAYYHEEIAKAVHLDQGSVSVETEVKSTASEESIASTLKSTLGAGGPGPIKSK